jgi:hypothetical protein
MSGAHAASLAPSLETSIHAATLRLLRGDAALRAIRIAGAQQRLALKEFWRAVGATHCPNLVHIALHNVYVSQHTIGALLEAIARTEAPLMTLCLTKCALGDEDVRGLCAAVKVSRAPLRTVRVVRHRAGWAAIVALREAVEARRYFEGPTARVLYIIGQYAARILMPLIRSEVRTPVLETEHARPDLCGFMLDE